MRIRRTRARRALALAAGALSALALAVSAAPPAYEAAGMASLDPVGPPSAVVGGNRRFSIAAPDTKPAAKCVDNADSRALRVAVTLKRIAGLRAERAFAVRRIRILVDGDVQAVRRSGRGVVYWQSLESGKPLVAAGRHVGSVELVSSSRPGSDGRTVTRRTRLSIPFYVCW